MLDNKIDLLNVSYIAILIINSNGSESDSEQAAGSESDSEQAAGSESDSEQAAGSET